MINRYVVCCTNPNNGHSCYFNAWFRDFLPVFDSDKGVVMTFGAALRVSNILRKFYPIVRICAVRFSSIYVEGVGHYFEAF